MGGQPPEPPVLQKNVLVICFASYIILFCSRARDWDALIQDMDPGTGRWPGEIQNISFTLLYFYTEILCVIFEIVAITYFENLEILLAEVQTIFGKSPHFVESGGYISSLPPLMITRGSPGTPPLLAFKQSQAAQHRGLCRSISITPSISFRLA